MKCERCGAGTVGYDLHDYCAMCSQNLCTSCMADGCCRHVPAISGQTEDYSEEEDEVDRD